MLFSFWKSAQISLFRMPTFITGHVRKDGTSVGPHMALRSKKIATPQAKPEKTAPRYPKLDEFIGRHGGEARLHETVMEMTPEQRGKLIDAMARLDGIDHSAVISKLSLHEPRPAPERPLKKDQEPAAAPQEPERETPKTETSPELTVETDHEVEAAEDRQDLADAMARNPHSDEAKGLIRKIANRERLMVKAASVPVRKTLYVSRPLKNAQQLVDWAKEQGFGKTLKPDDMHVTIAFSRAPVDWDDVGDSFDNVRSTNGERSVEKLGDKGAAVLRFECGDLNHRWQEFRDKGASWDWPGYKPHVTITYDGGDLDLSKVKPYEGPLEFGPEKFAEVVNDWEKKIAEG